MLKKLLLIFTVFFCINQNDAYCANVLSVEKKNFDQDRKARIILKNKYLQVSIAPFIGGVIDSLKYAGQEFTADSGILDDHMWDQKFKGDFFQVPYMYEIKKESDKLTVHLWCKGQTGAYKFVELHKYIVLTTNQTNLQVTYTFKNLPHSRSDITIKPWFHQVLGVGGNAHYIVPTTKGLKTVVYDPEKPGKDIWFFNPARSWSAVVGQNKKGVVCIPEYKWLHCFYNWFSENIGTLEWRFVPITISCGESFSTSFTLLPFNGLSSVDGAGNGLVGEISYKKGQTNGSIFIISERDRKIAYTITRENPITHSKEIINKGTIALLTNKKQSIPFEVISTENMVIRCELSDDRGTFLVDMEKPFIASKSVEYIYQPREKRNLPKRENIPWRYTIDYTYTRPHFESAKSFIGGQTKAFFIMDANTLRDVVELSSRMDLISSHATLFPSSGNYGAPWINPDKINISPNEQARIVNKESLKVLAQDIDGYQPDVIVIGSHFRPKYSRNKFTWKALNKQTRQKILNMVKEGTGLVFISPTDVDGEMREILDKTEAVNANHDIVRSFPFSLFKHLSPKSIRTVQFGRGRIVAINKASIGLIPYYKYHDFDFSFEEFLYSLLIKAIHWAGKKSDVAPVIIKSVEQKENSVTIPLNVSPEAVKAKIVIWRGKRIIEKDYEEDIRGKNNITIKPYGDLINGRHFANISIKDSKNRVLDWQLIPFQVKNPYSIASISMDRETYKKDDKIIVRIKVKNDNKNNEPGLTLTFQCRDNLGRLLFKKKKELSNSQNEQDSEFVFQVNDPLTVIHYAEATLNKGTRQIDYHKKRFLIPSAFQKRPIFTTSLWMGYQYYSPFLYPDIIKIAKNLGFDTQFEGTTWGLVESARFKAETDVRVALTNVLFQHVPHSTLAKYQKTKDKNLLIRKPCLNDPAYRERAKKRMKDTVRITKKYGTLQYMLGDEMSLVTKGGGSPLDICFSKHCLQRFRTYLKDTHNSLKELNRKWKTNYSSWEEVVPLTWQEAVNQKKYSSWLSHRSFMDNVWASWFKFCSDCIKEEDHATFTGECGIVPKISAYGGYDWSKKLKYSKVMAFYGLGDIPISFANRKEHFLGSYCMGYMIKEAGQQYRMWRALFHGQNMLNYWYVPLLINPDLTLSPYGTFLRPYLQELKSGIGAILASADYTYSPIAIHHSQKSCQISFLLKHNAMVDTYGAFTENLKGWNEGLREWGYCPRFVSSRQLESGELNKSKYRVLILPLSYVITEKEAEQIKKFIENGGIVIADAQTGLYDEFGNKRKQGILDDIMGVTRSNSGLTMKSTGFSSDKNGYMATFCEKGITTKGKVIAKANKGMQSFGGMRFGLTEDGLLTHIRIHNINKGKAVYLGGIKHDFTYQGKGNFIVDLLESQAIMPALKMISTDTNVRMPIEVGRFRTGDIEYFGLLRLPETIKGLNIKTATMKDLKKNNREVHISLPNKGHVYEIRSHKYLGFKQTISDGLEPAVAKLYAVLNEKPLLKISLPQKILQGQKLKLSLSSNILGEYPIYIGVISPRGKEISYFSSVDFIPVDGLVKEIPFALNTEKGKWKIQLRDIITGKIDEKEFTVE